MEIVLHMQPVIELDDEHFYALCQQNPDVRMERNVHGDVIIMPPTGGETSQRNAEIIIQLGIWSRRERCVEVYRPGLPVEVLAGVSAVSGEAVLSGFMLDLTRVWGQTIV